jgi:hypothetical protein
MRLWGVLVLILVPPSARAQQELVEKLLARIDQLERRVAELERQAGAKPAPVPVAEHHPAAESQPAAAAATPALKLAGFSDFNFAATDQRGVRSGFSEGQFILQATSALAARVNVFGELSLSARTDAGGGSPPATGFNAEVERLFIRFDQSDYFKVSFGRYHTPVNWWNTAYHHGQWLQTTISRPEMTQFGGRFIPVHFIGGLVEGALPAGGANLNYNVGLGNGRGSVLSRGGDAGDNNNHRAWLANLFVKPDRWYGLQLGGSVYRDKINVGPRDFREWITSGHLVWQKETPEVIAEVANVHHREIGGSGSFHSQAYYLQLGYRLPWWQQQWKPYYRWEYIHIPRTNPVFTGLPGLAGSVVGMRYDLTTFAAIKAEYRNQRRPGLPRINGGFLQTSFTF